MISASNGVDKIEKCVSRCDLHHFTLLNHVFMLMKWPTSSGKMTEIEELFHPNNGVFLCDFK